MVRHFYPDQQLRKRKRNVLLLAFCWLSGLFYGLVLYLSAGTSFNSLVRRLPFELVSIVCLLAVTALPFLLSLFLVLFSKPLLILPLCWFKALVLSFISCGILQSYDSFGWLFQHMVLFSDWITTPVLYWFWIRILRVSPTFWLDTLLSFILVFLTASLEHSIISPFMACLIDY